MGSEMCIRDRMSRELAILEKLEKDLSLKELQIKSLLTITQAINDNVPAEGLFNMYRSFLSWELGITKMGLFIPQDTDEERWHCGTQINLEKEEEKTEELIPYLTSFKRLHTIKPTDPEKLRKYDIIIPVYHKERPIAYSCLLYTSPSPRDLSTSRMPSSA